ncbi:hypothetical protein PR048_000139 [Dryococelus australis]|uniref:Uncharacterized protein n=1 Tax=Dryococelus australis TaxID=614101 RepID=A0ABQ9IED9_9NEOP|nr:hypothetical protein PR048_000139 [Dryococelus australis]
MRGSYDTRSHISVIGHKTKGESQKTSTDIWQDPAQLVIKKKKKKKPRKRKQTKLKNVKRRRLIMSGPDSIYSNINAVKMSKAEFETKKEMFKDQFRLTEYERNRLQEKISFALLNMKGIAFRKRSFPNRILICRWLNDPRGSKLSYPFRGNKATRYGLEKEPITIEHLSKELGIKPAGLFVDKDML